MKPMKKLFTNRAVIGMAAIFMSFIICFGMTPLVTKAVSAKTQLVRLKVDVEKGALITSAMMENVEVGDYNLPTDIIKNPDLIIGTYAKSDLYKGDYLTANKLSDSPLVNYPYLNDFDGNQRALSLTIRSFAAGFSGKLEQGDIVSLIATDYGEGRETLLAKELKYVEVLAVTAASGLDTEESQNQSEESDDNKDLPSTITLKVNEAQALLLADLESKGRIHVVFVYRGSQQERESFLNEQAVILESLSEKQTNKDQEIQKGDEMFE